MSDTADIEPEIHLGRLIRQELDRQQHTVAWLARCIHCDRTNCYLIFDKQYIDIPLLQRISKALHHNFFNELAEYMERVEKITTSM